MSDSILSPIEADLPALFQLEQRLMFDGAAVSTTAEVVSDAAETVTMDNVTESSSGLFIVEDATPLLSNAAEDATQRIKEFFEKATMEELFALFNGDLTKANDQWLEAMQSEISQILNGQQDIQIEILDSETMMLAKAAFSKTGTNGNPTIYLNSSLLSTNNNDELVAILIEEFGHLIDSEVNGNIDTDGDEGQSFASAVLGQNLSERNVIDDQGTLSIDDQLVEVERATYSFVNAYEVDTSRTPAGKEANTHDFLTTNLGAPTVDDNNFNSKYFSGNDVSAAAINIDGTTYFGWISRPIKSGGIVRGFYFWTDVDFVDLATAQADGNTDGDGDVSDNRGFILVVDQAWFDAQSEIAAGIKNVGSSSDRVDSALNALIPTNTAPTATTDTDTAVEDGGLSNATSGSGASGNVLTNDSDSDVGDSIAVTYAGTTSANQTVPASGTVDVTGRYGTLTIAVDGSYTYALTSNNDALVEALRLSTDTLSDIFTYSIADSEGSAATTTLAITIEGANDNPVGSDDYNTAKESLRGDNTAYDNTDPLGSVATGNVLTNDSDVDGNGETLSVGALEGTITIDAVTTNLGAVSLIFLGESGFNSVSAGQTLYYNDGGTYRALHDSGGGLITVSSAPTQDPDVSTTYFVPLSGTPTYFLDAGLNQVSVGALDSIAIGFKSAIDEITGTNSMKTATVSSSEATGTSTIDITPSNSTGLIAIGMTVSGTGVPANTTITDITYNVSGEPVSLELDQVVMATASTVLSFYAATGTTVTGQHGDLVLNADGSYVYTPFAVNPNLSEGESGIDSFEYSVLDLAGAAHNAILNITVYGSGVNDPNAVTDTAIATEAGGIANATAGVDPSGNVLGNDTTPVGANVIDSVRSIDDGTATIIGTNTVVVGQYGTLTISTDGSWTYALNNSNSDVEALRTNFDELTDVFVCFVKNGQTGAGGDLQDSDTLTITIQGANDNPIASDDIADATEAGGVNNAVAGYDPTGNVLTNDTDVDDEASALVVTAIRTGSIAGAGTSGAVGSALIGTYGYLTLNSNGSWSYIIDNSNSAVNALAVGETLTEIFNYTVTDGSGVGLDDIALLSITIKGAADTVVVNDIFVNEGTDFAIFTVTGAAGINVELALSESIGLPAGDAKAILGTDTAAANTLEYFDGSNWLTYNAGSPPVIPVGGELFVRIAITQDDVHEGNESFTLVATTSDGSQVSGIGTINDEGEGDIFLPDNDTGAPDAPGILDDDRPTISITDAYIDEGDYAIFTVSLDGTSIQDISFSPNLSDDTAVIGTDTAAANTLEVSFDNGGTWTIVSGSVTIFAGETSVKLRIDTTDDNDVEGIETFKLSTGIISGTVINSDGVVATATITDNDFANQVPTVKDNDYSTTEDTNLTATNIITDTDTAGTDNDPDGDALNISDVNGTAWASLTDSSDPDHLSANGWKMVGLTNGTIYLKSDGTMDYSPNNNFNGDVSFTYNVTDGVATSASAATVTITVNAVNDDPDVGGDTSGSGDEDTIITGTLTTTDVDGMTDGTYYTITGEAANGSASIDPVTGEWSYEPNADYNGDDSFTVTITDDDGNTTTLEIALTINPIADIVDDEDRVDEDSSVITNVLDNDTFEGIPTVTAVTQGSNGTVTIIDANTGEVSYTPNADFNGTDTYTYTVTVGGITETATVTITVNAKVKAPTPVPPSENVTASNPVPPASPPAPIIEKTSSEPVEIEAPASAFVDLVVQRDIPEQTFTATDGNVIVDFSIPADTFGFIGNPDLGGEIQLSAIMIDGTAVPEWLIFDADTGRFYGIVPDGFEGTLSIRVIAVDGEGKQVDTIVTIKISKAGSAAEGEEVTANDNGQNAGKIAFLEQLKGLERQRSVDKEQISRAAQLLKNVSEA